MTRVVVVCAVAALLAGCVPQASFDPVAVKLGSSSGPEILYTSCTAVPVQLVEVVTVEENGDDGVPSLWRIEFPEGTRMTSFTVGATPQGAVERVHWQPPGMDEPLRARMVLEGGIHVYQGFELRELKADEVVFHDRSISADEFARAAACQK